MPLTTAELAERLEAAVENEEVCRVALARLQVESATAGEAPSVAEREAETALTEASATIARLTAALEASEARDRAEVRKAALAQLDIEDNVALDKLAAVEKQAGKVTAALEGYCKAYDALARTVQDAHSVIFCHPRLRRDSTLPRVDLAVSEEMSRLAVGMTLPPGASTHAVQFGDPSQLPPLVEVFAGFGRAFRGDLAAAKAARG